MSEVFINVKNTDLEELFDTDLVSIDELVSLIEEQQVEIDKLKEKIADEEQIREDFYRPKSPYEVCGISERDFV